MRLVAPENLSNRDRIDWYNTEENTKHYLYGCRGGWQKYADNPVLGKNKAMGTSFDMAVIERDGRYHMWFSWRPYRGIGYTVSDDGLHWGEPRLVLSPVPGSPYENDEINRPTVLWKGGRYHMWYSGQMNPYREGGVSVICYAVSDDGIRWERPCDRPVLVPDQPWERTAIMCPHVMFDEKDGRYKLWYSGGSNHEPDAIGYAWSRDGIRWEKEAGNPILEKNPDALWEQHKVVGCQVLRYGDWYYMFYIGHMHEERGSVGLARSRDGIHGWEKHPHNPLIAPDREGFDSVSVYKPFALKRPHGWILWYNGAEFDENLWVYECIGAALHEGDALFD